ncbi:MAG: MlaE family ABC transporter permease [Planctomycetota bacterium]
MRFLETAQSLIIKSIIGAGYTLILLWYSFLYTKDLYKRRRFILEQAFITGIKPLPVILVTGVFTGMILALQIGMELDRYGQHEGIAYIIGSALCREMGPFMTALILTASVGSGMAAEIGTMRVSEEIDALEVMSINPVNLLVMPRVFALSIMCPVLTLVCNIVGTMGGGLIGKTQFDIDYHTYFDLVMRSLSGGEGWFGLPKDLYTGLIKAWVFGLMIAAIGCSKGLRATGGALGVGQATRTAVINSFLLIIILGYYMTWLFYR